MKQLEKIIKNKRLFSESTQYKNLLIWGQRGHTSLGDSWPAVTRSIPVDFASLFATCCNPGGRQWQVLAEAGFTCTCLVMKFPSSRKWFFLPQCMSSKHPQWRGPCPVSQLITCSVSVFLGRKIYRKLKLVRGRYWVQVFSKAVFQCLPRKSLHLQNYLTLSHIKKW